MAVRPPYHQAPTAQSPPKKGTGTCLIVGLVLLAVSVPLVGMMAALGIYGIRRYLALAKSAEAKNNVVMIARHAAAAYERERLLDGRPPRRLCGSATSVPARPPSAAKYLPAAGEFATGNEDEGWACLKVSFYGPIYYQYHYHQGSGWIAPELAVGSDGFEAAAVGDLDGDGVHSRFARVGRVVGGELRTSTDLFIDQEFE